MGLLKRILLIPIYMCFLLIYKLGDFILKVVCNFIGFILPIVVLSLIYLIVNKLWVSVLILAGSIVAILFMLLVFSIIVFYFDDIRNMMKIY